MRHSIRRLWTMSEMHACMRACMRSAVETPPPPTFAPTLLGGTARVPSRTCAPFESVRTRARLRVDAAVRRSNLCARVHASALTPRCQMVLTRAFVCVRACVRACKCVCACVCVGHGGDRRY